MLPSVKIRLSLPATKDTFVFEIQCISEQMKFMRWLVRVAWLLICRWFY